jgi:hypothetical protein
MAEQSLLCSLPTVLPDLVRITIDTQLEPDTAAFGAITATVSNFVCGCSRLKDVSFAVPLTHEALSHLRDMPVLRDLTLTLSEDNENIRYLAHPSRPPFLALRELCISCRDISSSDTLQNAIPWYQVESITVDVTGERWNWKPLH